MSERMTRASDVLIRSLERTWGHGCTHGAMRSLRTSAICWAAVASSSCARTASQMAAMPSFTDGTAPRSRGVGRGSNAGW